MPAFKSSQGVIDFLKRKMRMKNRSFKKEER